MPYKDLETRLRYARGYYRKYRKTLKGRRGNTLACQKWREKNRTKRRAHGKVGRALRTGRLARMPCEVCGSTYVDAHHTDYRRPLVVL